MQHIGMYFFQTNGMYIIKYKTVFRNVSSNMKCSVLQGLYLPIKTYDIITKNIRYFR